MGNSTETVKVHMIANAHLDPVWLWSWQAGVDEALATAHTTVRVLKEYPDLFFTRSDVWFHKIIEELNHSLFEEISELIAEGRWCLVGGWYIQPDCNLPTEFGFEKHISFGKRYFKEKFNKEINIGYNVDSFGHAGSLPRILSQAGYDYYIYMRPGAHEKEYPNGTQVFRWQASDSEDELIAYRIPVAYCCSFDNLDEHIRKTIDASDKSLGHIMCFFGVGDHGGGPTREQIEFIIANRKKYEGCELIFSHPAKYFEAISSKSECLPIVKGELQHHAVGCYSVVHKLKKDIKSAEHKLVQAEKVIRMLPQYVSSSYSEMLDKSWEDVLFNHFHDTMGGTCLKSAYDDVYAQLGRAYANADEIITKTVRRYSSELSGLKIDELRLGYFAVMNTSGASYNGWVEHEIFGLFDKEFKVVDFETGREIPIQRISSESVACSFARVLLPVELSAGQTRVFGIERGKPSELETDIVVAEGNDGVGAEIGNKYWRISSDKEKIRCKSASRDCVVDVQASVYEDLSDTWSHGILRLGGEKSGRFERDDIRIAEKGWLRAILFWNGCFDNSQMKIKAGLYREDEWLELRIKLVWNQPLSVAKLEMSFDSEIIGRVDGIPGGVQNRELDGKEYPICDWTVLNTDTSAIAIICPDIFGLDVQRECVRFTLVRSPVYAHHHPTELDENKKMYDFTDIGEHEYRILIGCRETFDYEYLRKFANQLQQSVIHWDPPYRG